MRIGYLTNHYPRATDTFIQREVAALRTKGFEVRTFSVRRPGSEHDVSAEVAAEKRATHYILPAGPFRVLYANAAAFLRAPRGYLAALGQALRTSRPGLRGLALQMAYFQEAVVLSLELRRQGITHLHNHGGDNSGTVTLLAAELTQLGYSITIHGPHIFFDPTHWALREKLRQARFIACISHYCRSQVMLFSDPEDWERLKLVRCGIDVERYLYAEVRGQVRQLFYAGRLAVEKGLPILFESLRILQARGYDLQLTLAGGGEDRDKLEQLASELGISQRVAFVGYLGQEEVREHLRRSDIFILPSFAEGVPVSLMEAMACGVPVLSTYVGGIAELVETGETGLLVPAGDSNVLSEAIARYCDDLELRRRVSRLAREKIESSFNLGQEVDRLGALFLAAANS
jgi:colanic acid/amylovoran biosynthesis glycosyltransferase